MFIRATGVVENYLVVALCFFVFALMAGCTSGIRRDVGSLEGRVASLEGVVEKHGQAVTTLFSQQVLTADLLKQTAESLEDTRGRTEEAHKRISAVEADVRGKLAAIERRVTGIHSVVSSATARVGVMEDASGLDTRVRVFRISGFRSGGAEIPTGWGPDGVKKAIADGYILKAVVGFADSQCPSKGDCEEVNRQLAEARAKVIAGLVGADGSVLVEGRGTTDRFGSTEVNRSVVVYLERDVPGYVPLRGPAGQQGPQGIQGPEGPQGPPGLVQVVTVDPTTKSVAVNSGSPAPSASGPALQAPPIPPTGNP